MTRASFVSALACFCLGLGAAANAQDHVAPGLADHAGHGGSTALDDVLAEIRPEFSLLDRNGRAVSAEDFRGRYVLLAFGFTHCEHICPLMALKMGQVLDGSAQDAAGIFVSVDTERDSPEINDDYAAAFGARMMGLGGGIEQISAAAKNFRVAYAVTKTQDNYTVQHTANIYLIDPAGELVDVFPLTASPAEMMAAMQPR